MKTLFGKELTRIRLDNNISLKDMATGLKVPSSYLSAVESASKTNGKKLTNEFLERILNYLSLDEDKERYLRTQASRSTGELVIDASALEEKQLDTLAMFAKRIGTLPDYELEKIRQSLNNKIGSNHDNLKHD